MTLKLTVNLNFNYLPKFVVDQTRGKLYSIIESLFSENLFQFSLKDLALKKIKKGHGLKKRT